MDWPQRHRRHREGRGPPVTEGSSLFSLNNVQRCAGSRLMGRRDACITDRRGVLLRSRCGVAGATILARVAILRWRGEPFWGGGGGDGMGGGGLVGGWGWGW